MRMRLGRPDLPDRFSVPAASGALSVTFGGVATLLFDDGETSVLTDGFFSRPSLLRVGLGRIGPDHGRIVEALARLGGTPPSAVVPVHTHFDHAMDSAEVARVFGAALIGGPSVAALGRGAGLPAGRLVAPDVPLVFGGWTLTLIESAHCPPDRFPGEIIGPLTPPVRAGAYRCGTAWSVLVRHSGGRSALVQGSAGFVPGALDGIAADVVYLGVGQLGVLDEEYMRAYWFSTVSAVGARRVVLIHWDDFFRPLSRPLRALPYAGDDLGATMRVLDELAAEQGVSVHLPTVFRREDPWL